MKITKRQLRRIIKEAITSDSDLILGAITEMGYDLSQPPTLDSNNTAIDDALTGYPGEFTYEDIIAALEDHKAASEILSTRTGDYSSSHHKKGLAGQTYEKTLADYKKHPEWFN